MPGETGFLFCTQLILNKGERMILSFFSSKILFRSDESVPSGMQKSGLNTFLTYFLQ